MLITALCCSADKESIVSAVNANKPNLSSQVVAAGANVLVTFTNVSASAGVTFLTDTTLKILTAGLYIFTTNLEWGRCCSF